jgi:non-canonical purine NTP pyrophosphatase (RdgB/HAM1 family)
MIYNRGMLYFVTGNAGKFAEVKAAIPEVEQIELDLPEVQSIDPQAIIKAKLDEALRQTKNVCILEDTSLYLEALNYKLPGPLIKCFEEGIGNEGIAEIAEKFQKFGAEARTIIGYIGSDGVHRFFEGSLRGKIVSPRGQGDFGWGPIFTPEGEERTFAEMSRGEKRAVSMRTKAINKLKDYWQGVAGAHAE